ncbi:hypothetical protein [Roseateles sp.]|uniref:hypothetical protein n=1 Tax=Roseateles sp. TaxID=1971397 RepID=UPI002F42FE06
MRPLRDQMALAKLESEVGQADVALCPPLLVHILAGWDVIPLLESSSRLQHQAEWRALFDLLANTSPPSPKVRARFHTQWHVSHHFIRGLVDDDRLMLAAARAWLPRYEGPDLKLFRGENLGRYRTGRIGYGWTDRLSIAEMFAAGPNSVGTGGVVLTANVPAAAIVAGPASHSSDWLQENEFTVDVALLEAVSVVA